MGHVIVGRGAAEGFAIAFGDLRLIAQGADVVPFAHAHRATGFVDGHLNVELGEGFDEDLRWRERAEIDHGAGPVEDRGLQFAWVYVVHGNKNPVLAMQFKRFGDPVGAGLPAMGPFQSTSMLMVRPLSRASPLPQVSW